jgi:histone H3/H4
VVEVLREDVEFAKWITWVLTALVDEEIPVAFVSTPQFTVAQQLTAEKSKWREAQLTGRIAHFEQLPESLSVEDLEAVARAWLPSADNKSIEILVSYAEASDKYLQAIGALAQRAIYLAKKDGRETPTAKDIKEALRAGVIPSDSAIATATEQAINRIRGRQFRRDSTAARLRESRVRESATLQDPFISGSQGERGEPCKALIPDKVFGRKGNRNHEESVVT